MPFRGSSRSASSPSQVSDGDGLTGVRIHVWLPSIVSHHFFLLLVNLTWSSTCLYLILFSVLFCHLVYKSSLSVFTFPPKHQYILLASFSFNLQWVVSPATFVSTLPTPNFLNFTVLVVLTTLQSRAIGFTLTSLRKEWSWSVSWWEILWCYRTSSSIKLGNYWEQFYTWLEITPLATCHWQRAPFRRERAYCNSEYVLFALREKAHIVYYK